MTCVKLCNVVLGGAGYYHSQSSDVLSLLDAGNYEFRTLKASIIEMWWIGPTQAEMMQTWFGNHIELQSPDELPTRSECLHKVNLQWFVDSQEMELWTAGIAVKPYKETCSLSKQCTVCVKGLSLFHIDSRNMFRSWMKMLHEFFF